MSAPGHVIGHIAAIAELRQRIAALERRTSPGRPAPVALTFGLSAIDAALPGGGLARPGVHEITAGGPPFAATLFAAGILARTSGPVLWCLRRRDLFAPGLAGAGLHPDRLILIEAGDRRAVLRAMEEGLRHGGLGAVLGEIDRLGLTESRRLQLAAEAGGALGLVLSHPFAASAAGERQSSNVATTRWRITALSSAPLPVPGIG